MPLLTWVLLGALLMLLLLSVYQHLMTRTALEMSELLYILSRNVRHKAADVWEDEKDVEIVEARLLDLSAAARGR